MAIDAVLNMSLIIGSAITAGVVVSSLVSYFKSGRAKTTIDDNRYKQICDVTCKIESDRRPNTGIHYDESVYLKRAHNIGENTTFFEMVTSVGSRRRR